MKTENWRKASYLDNFILNLQSVIPKVDNILNVFRICLIYENVGKEDSDRFAIPAITPFNIAEYTFNAAPYEFATIWTFC